MIILLVVASIPCVLVVVVMVVGALSHVGVSPTPSQPTATATPSQPTATATATPSYAGPSYAGRLLLQEFGSDFSFAGIRELQEGWTEPREATDLGFDTSLITGRIISVSPDRRYLVFRPHFLLDTKTGEKTPLLRPGLTDAEPDYEVRGVAFSPDGNRVAYRVFAPRPALFTLDITSKQTRMIHDCRCAEYGLYGVGGTKECEGLSDPSWIGPNTLVFSYREGLPRSYEIGSDDAPRVCNRIEVATYEGEVILSTESPPWYGYRAIGETVFSYRHVLGGGVNAVRHARTWLDAADLRNGIYEAHELEGSGLFIQCVSPDGRYILRYSRDDLQWHLYEVRTGQETILATAPPLREDDWPGGCVWSPDETTVACVTIHRFAAGELNILLIPLSDEPGGIVFTDATWGHEDRWMLFDWRP